MNSTRPIAECFDRFDPSSAFHSRRIKRPLKATSRPFARYCAHACACLSNVATSRYRGLLSPGESLAIRSSQTGRPSGIDRSSGSLVSRPVRLRLFTAVLLFCPSAGRGWAYKALSGGGRGGVTPVGQRRQALGQGPRPQPCRAAEPSPTMRLSGSPTTPSRTGRGAHKTRRSFLPYSHVDVRVVVAARIGLPDALDAQAVVVQRVQATLLCDADGAFCRHARYLETGSHQT